MAQDLSGRVAIVTGAAQGIGAAYAKALAAAGAKVVVSDIASGASVVDAIQSAGGTAMNIEADVTSAASVRALVDRTITTYGRIDILINNAAIFGQVTLKPFTEITSEEWDRMMAVNVRGSFEAAKAVVPQMKKQGYGKIVNIASGTVYKGAPMLMHYVCSKGAVIAMSRCMARELGADGIRVNTLAPGLTMSDNVLANPAWSKMIVEGNTATRALKREQVPEDLTGTMVYLCSAASDFMTGQVMVVDGGSALN
jgi:NAD(P)-dependent dehydrogenase (short-subunit alcohol dehydrogenase family)